jgi:hypothetical protein
VEQIPTGGGDVVAGAGGRRKLPAPLVHRVERLGGADAAPLKKLLSDAGYGAPQKPLVVHHDATAEPLPKGSLSAGVAAVAGGDSRVLAFVLAGIVLTTILAGATALRRARR